MIIPLLVVSIFLRVNFSLVREVMLSATELGTKDYSRLDS